MTDKPKRRGRPRFEPMQQRRRNVVLDDPRWHKLRRIVARMKLRSVSQWLRDRIDEERES